MLARRDAVVVILGAAATLWTLWAFRDDPLVAATVAAIAAVSTWLSVIDFNEHRLPNRIVLPLAIFATVAVLILGLVDEDLERAVIAIATGLGFFAVLFAFGLFGGIGMGDVKFSYPLVVVLAWFGADSVRAAAWATILAGGVYTVSAMIRNRSTKMQIPFGPFMAIGFVAGALVAAS